MKHRILLFFSFLLATSALQAQIFEPVKWSFDHKLDGDKHAILSFTAKIESGWHMYANKLESDMGPIPTTFDFLEIEGAELVGGIVEPKPHKEYDPNFDMELSYFEKSVTFTQKVKLTAPQAVVAGEITFMVCDESKCLPPEYPEFAFKIEAALKPSSKPAKPEASPADATRADLPAEKEVTTEPEKDAEALPAPQETESQVFEPVSWSFDAVKKDDNTYTLVLTAEIEDGWHVYSKDLPSEDGPIATEVNFFPADGYKLVGDLREIGDLHEEYDPNFMMELAYYEHSYKYEQDITVEGSGVVSGEIYFMVCDSVKCLPPEAVNFEFDPTSGKIYNPDEISESSTSAGPLNLKIESINLSEPLAECGDIDTTEGSGSGLWSIFFLGFLGGLVALLTPCVFPMIPLTVSFFTKGSENKQKGLMNAFLYGLCIFLIYVVLSLPFHFLDTLDPEILNSISTNAWLNVGFFVIFIVFAISFFGYFEITLPSGMANKVDSASSIGGLIGIFFMALTLAIVSFSCTGPILGSLLAGSLTADGGAMQLTAGMGGFGLALALPFGLFAAFPGWLNSLPKSGSWLNTVKVVLGFVEVALAIKFLSNADLVEHWGLVKIELFLGSWILVGIGLSLYLFGVIKFPHDSPYDKIGVGRKSLGVLSAAFTIYLMTGFMYSEQSHSFRSLTLLSGLAPPAGYSWIHPNDCPLNLNCFHDYESGLAYAKEVQKPIMIDFTGYACVNCRKMEEQVWSKPEIYDLLNEDFVLISLYVDDREKLPEEEQFEFITSTGKKKKIRTVGDKWATMETETFGTNAQPHYALISPDEQLLNTPVGYTPEVKEYKTFLQCGLDAMKQMNGGQKTASIDR